MSALPYLKDNEVSWARKRLMLGAALADVADGLGITASELDLILWRRLCRMAERRDAA